MNKAFTILTLLLVIACTSQVPEVEPVKQVQTELYPPHPQMEPPIYEPLQNIPEAAPHVFKIDVMQSGCTPAEINVNSGDKVKLLVTALDFDHDFRMPAFGIAEQLPKMQEMEINIDADTVGEFEYQCVKYCDPGSAGVLRVV